jgi:hypothetical protein
MLSLEISEIMGIVFCTCVLGSYLRAWYLGLLTPLPPLPPPPVNCPSCPMAEHDACTEDCFQKYGASPVANAAEEPQCLPQADTAFPNNSA